jgi:hypothetical protein
MNKFIKAEAFLKHLFDSDRLAAKAAIIVEAILAACSPRISEIAQHMPGGEAANYKMVQRFLKLVDVKALLWRLFQADAPFVIGDPTEMPRPQARKTDYVGKLKDGKTRGFWLLLLATPYRGRALPCGFVTYSSKTIAQQARSRNQFHWQAFDEIKSLLGDKPLVLDREFSYLELLDYFVQVRVNFVIRLNLASHPTFYDATGRKVVLTVSLGEQVVYRGLRYMDQVTVNVVGVWRKGCAEPLWVMSNLSPEQALTIYAARVKIEETFRDLKQLLNLDKLMNKSQHHMEQMAALVMLAFTIGILAGETLRDALYGLPETTQTHPAHAQRVTETVQSQIRRKWQGYSGLFLILKHKRILSAKQLRLLYAQAATDFAQLVQPLPLQT